MPPSSAKDARGCHFYSAEGCHFYPALTQCKFDNISYVKFIARRGRVQLSSSLSQRLQSSRIWLCLAVSRIFTYTLSDMAIITVT